MRPLKVYHSRSVKVVKYAIEWAEFCTDDLIQATGDRFIRALDENHGAHFHNPEYSVFAPSGSDLAFFIRHARRAQTLWQKRLVRVFGRKAKRRMIKDEPPKRRLFFSTGILVIGGQNVHPEAWPDTGQAGRKRPNHSPK